MSGDAVVLLLEALFLANAVFFGFVVIFLLTFIGFFWIFFKWLLLQRLASVVSVFVSGS